MGSCNYFAFTIQMGSNCYINTDVRDLDVKLILPEEMALVAKIY